MMLEKILWLFWNKKRVTMNESQEQKELNERLKNIVLDLSNWENVGKITTKSLKISYCKAFLDLNRWKEKSFKAQHDVLLNEYQQEFKRDKRYFIYFKDFQND